MLAFSASAVPRSFRGASLSKLPGSKSCTRRPRMSAAASNSSPAADSDGATTGDIPEGRRFGKGAKKYSGDPMAGPRLLPRSPPSSYEDKGTAIVWFRNDLRILDNPALALGNTAERMVPIYVFDERHYSMDYPSPHGFQRTGQYRAHFNLQSVKLLKRALKYKMSDLVVRAGFTEDAIADLAQTLVKAGYGPVRVVAQKETARDETDMEEAVAEAVAEVGVAGAGDGGSTAQEIDFVWGATLLHPDDMKFNPGGPALPPTFTQFRKEVEAEPAVPVRSEIQPPEEYKFFPMELRLKSDDWPSLRKDLKVEGIAEPHDYPFPDRQACFQFNGGEEIGLQRIEDWIFIRRRLSTYFDTRNNSGTSDDSSKFSPFLANGCISPRTVYWEVKRYEEQKEASKSTYWMIFELLTRDYFRFVAAQAGDRLFALNGFSGDSIAEKPVWRSAQGAITATAKKRFDAWVAGETGAPFVDAPMRELMYTGFMSNRGRQNAASFLIHDLEYPDWRAGAEYFESQLIDHDVAANWCNWAYIAGVGSDSRGGRRFNVVKQSMDYDPTGWYMKRWCEELADIPAPFIHQPHLLTEEDCKALEFDRESYPLPIVPLQEPPAATVAALASAGVGISARPLGGGVPQESTERSELLQKRARILKELTVYPGASDESTEAGEVMSGVEQLHAMADRIRKGLE